MAKDFKYTDHNGNELFLIDFQKFQALGNSPNATPLEVKFARNLRESRIPSWRVQKLFYNEDLLSLIDGMALNDLEKIGALCLYAPPVAGLTINDWKHYLEAAIENANAENQKAKSNYSRGYRSVSMNYHYGNGYHTGSSYSAAWRENLIAKRSKTLPANKNHSFISLLSSEFMTPNFEKMARPAAREAIALNEYLVGEGKEFEGTFREWLAVAPTFNDKTKEAFSQYIYQIHADESFTILSFCDSKHVASFGSTATLKQRNLIIDQDRKAWKLIITAAQHYSKGKTFEHTEVFLHEIAVKLGRAAKEEAKVYDTSELRRAYTLLVAEAVLFEGPYYNASKLHGLATLCLQLVPSEHTLAHYAKEYSEILEIVKAKLNGTKKEEATLASILSVDDEDEGKTNNQAAVALGKLTLQQTVTLLLASFYPKGWIRGNTDNAPFLLTDILRDGEGFAGLDLLSGIIFEHNPAAPTSKEWRAGLETVSLDMPAAFWLTLVCSIKAQESAARRTYPAEVNLAREIFHKKK